MNTLEHLIATRQRIANGWHQGDSFAEGMDPNDPNTPCCLLGALTITGPHEHGAKALLCRLADAAFLTQWNDAPERTQQDVLDLLDRAIASLAPQGTDPIGQRR